MSAIYRVMFVCTGNTCRSPMAEGALRKLLENRGINGIEVFSSGTGATPMFPATDYAIEACRVWDADISGHHSQPLLRELVEISDLILAMAPAHCHRVLSLDPTAGQKVFLLKNFPEPGCVGEGVDDPIGGSLDVYNRAFIEIGEEIGRILPYIIELAGESEEELPRP